MLFRSQAVETCEVSTNIIISTPSVVSCDMQVPFEEREQIPFEKEEVPFEEREQVVMRIVVPIFHDAPCDP